MYIEENLYQKIVNVFPIPCVDLLITNEKDEILLIKRVNSPEKGEWWFPGGRIYKNESREQAAIRKLQEECGISEINTIHEIGTYDLFLSVREDEVSHGITTLFGITTFCQEVQIDKQSSSYEWKTLAQWNKIHLHNFLKSNLNLK